MQATNHAKNWYIKLNRDLNKVYKLLVIDIFEIHTEIQGKKLSPLICVVYIHKLASSTLDICISSANK